MLTAASALVGIPAFSTLARGMRGASPLVVLEFLSAVRRGDLEFVRAALARDITLARSVDEVDRSAFVLAHLHGHEAVAQAIAEAGVEFDLVESVLAEDWDRFEVLAEAYPEDLNAAHPIGGTPMYAAALVGSDDFWRLRSKGCLPDVIPKGGSGYSAARGAMESIDTAWARIALSDLCSNGSDVNAAQRGGSSVLHGTVTRRDATLVRLAIRKGADVNAKDEAGRTPLALAQSIDWKQGVELLKGHEKLPRDHRASRFAWQADGSPVVRSNLSSVPQAQQSEVTGNSHGNIKRVRELVEGDPRLVFSISTDDELAIEASAHMGNHDLMRFHLDHGAPMSLPTAVSLGDLEGIERLLEQDPDLVHERGAHDFPVMWYVVTGGASIEVAEFVTARGVGIEQESVGGTALHRCVLRGAEDLAHWLIEKGANLEAVGYRWDRRGQTPLQLAQSRGYDSMVKLLREAGAAG